MNTQEMSAAWQDFNARINSVEKVNRQILVKMISTKSERKLLMMKYQSLIGVILSPIILLFILIPVLINSGITHTSIFGALSLIVIIGYYLFHAIKHVRLITAIKPVYDSILSTKQKLISLSKHIIDIQKRRNIIYPFFVTAIILTFWNAINLNLVPKITVLAVMTIGLYFWGNYKYKLYYHDRIAMLQNEITEIQEIQN